MQGIMIETYERIGRSTLVRIMCILDANCTMSIIGTLYEVERINEHIDVRDRYKKMLSVFKAHREIPRGLCKIPITEITKTGHNKQITE